MDKKRKGGVDETKGGGGGKEEEENPPDEVKQVERSKSGTSISSPPPGDPQTHSGSSVAFPNVTHSQRDSRGRFINPWSTWKNISQATFLRIFMMEKNNSNVPSSKKVLDEKLPVLEPFFVRSPESVGSVGSGLRVTWLGHASVLVEMDGLVILTDPIFSQRASPVQFVGYKRYRAPPCSVDQLPRLDVVLISHTHYDHLDLASVKALNRRFGADLHWLVPLGLLNWLRRRGCQKVTQLDWWEKTCIPAHEKVTFVCTPAQHWCKRTLLDDNRALWGSWSVLGSSRRFFFGGDTGYCSSFQEIGRCLGPFDLAAIPIGAYQPRRILCSQHVDPEEAVKIHIDVQAKHSLAIHWGTFALSYEYYLEPPVKLKEAMEQQGRDPKEFFILNHGESRLLDNSTGTKL